MLKVDEEGNVVWEKNFGGPETDLFLHLPQTYEGDIFLSGQTFSIGQGSGDGYLVKTNSMGTLEWETSYGGAEIELFHEISVTSDYKILLAGSSRSYSSNLDTDAYLVKIEAGIPVSTIALAEEGIPYQLVSYPNPSSGSVWVDFNNEKGMLEDIVLYDNLGKRIRADWKLADGVLEIKTLRKGHYTLSARQRNHRCHSRFVVLK